MNDGAQMMSEISPLQIDSHLRHHLQIIFFTQALSSFRIFLNFLNAFTNFPLKAFFDYHKTL